MEALNMFSSANDFCSSTELFDFGLDSDFSDEQDFLEYDTCPYFTPPPSPPQQGRVAGTNECGYLKQLIMPDTKNLTAVDHQDTLLPEEDCGYVPMRVKKEVPDIQQQNWKPALSNVSPVVEKKSSKLPSDSAKLKAPRRGMSSSKPKKLCSDKESEEYRLKRARNNIAVRKSRFKSKMKTVETEQKVQELSEENSRLQSKVEYLTKELTVLRNLIANSNLMK